MPAVDVPTPLTAVAGVPRDGVARHDFRGANFLTLGMLDRHRAELGVTAPGPTLAVAMATTRAFLEHASARVAIASLSRSGAALIADIDVENLGGHKLPTAYPSRRVWIHVTVRDATGAVRFESGKLLPTGAIEGNPNDGDPHRFEPHHAVIHAPGEVQIYEAILGDPQGHVTTALLSTSQYLKDNRLLPRGFVKATASLDTAVHGEALADTDFVDGRDRVRYALDVGDAPDPLAIDVELMYQPVGYRWAHNLAPYAGAEPQRYVDYYDEMARASAIVLAHADQRVQATAR